MTTTHEPNLVDVLKQVGVPQELAFPLDEYRARQRRMQERMDERGLDLLLVSNISDLCYLIGFQTFFSTWYSCLALPRSGEPFLQTAEIEVPATLVHGPVEDIEIYPWYESTEAGAQLGPILQRRGLASGRIGVQLTGGLAAIDYERLKGALPTARFEDVSNLVYELRVTKRPQEIEFMRKAGAITVEGIRAAQAALATASTDSELAAASAQAMHAAGGEYFSMQPIFTTGHRSGLVHLNHKRIPLKAGDNVFMEVGGVYNRYCSPVMRTSVLGEPSAAVRQLESISKRSFELLQREVRAGRTGHDVSVAIGKELRQLEGAGSYYHGYFGYSVGISFPPHWGDGPMYIAEDWHHELKPGMTFHTARANRIPGRVGVGISETIVVTETGCEVLTEGMPRELHVVGR
jgi:Xaa-Pro aminopeptidase